MPRLHHAQSFTQNNTPMKVVMAMPSNETIKQEVMAGMGLSFLSMRTIRHELASGQGVQGLFDRARGCADGYLELRKKSASRP